LPAPLDRRVPPPLRAQRDRAPGSIGPATRDGEHSRLLRRGGEPVAGAALAAALLRGDQGGLPARPATRLARGPLSRPRAGGVARRIPTRARGGAARRRRPRRP